MTRVHRFIIASILTLAVSLTGCMGKKEPERSPEKKEDQAESKGESKKEEDPIASGSSKMQAKLSQLREALAANDATQVRKQARALDDSWESFERRVETKNPDMYARVERSLNAVLTGATLVPVDNRAIQAEMDRLDTTLQELKESKGTPEKLQKVDIKTGAAAMRHQLTALRTAVDSGDTAKMQEQTKAVDRSWTQFETEVKEKQKTRHAAIEDQLHAIWAGVNKSPVDKAGVKQHIDKLDAELEAVSK